MSEGRQKAKGLASQEAERLYGDILNLPHPVSRTHPPLSAESRAAQFSPFAALTGYDEVLRETARLTCARQELDESRKAELDLKLRQVAAALPGGPRIRLTYFVPDGRKAGGSYVTLTGRLKKADGAGHLIWEDGRVILVEDLYDLSVAPDQEE